MFRRLVVLLVVLPVLLPGSAAKQKQIRLRHFHEDTSSDLEDDEEMDDFLLDSELEIYPKTNSTKMYTQWSPWSMCLNCLQRRMKKCINVKCHGSRMYEEKQCNKRRCKKKLRHKMNERFHVVHLNKSSSYLTKQGPSDVWSKWSRWSNCSRDCRTYRIRRCKKPGRCRKQVYRETAYCYHEQTQCEIYVLALMESKGYQDVTKYEYNEKEQHLPRQPRQRREKKCGMPYRRTSMLKIIGGTEAKRYQWPWHVAVLNQYMEVFCGGTLVAPRWVLTASHCVRQYLRVRLNAHDLRAHDGRDVEMTVQKVFPHPRFDYRTVDNDVALLLLPRAVRAPVACLPTRRPRPKTMCSVMGWGKVRAADAYGVPVLHEAQLPIVKQRTCKKSYRRFLISNNMLCAGWSSGRADTCAGDSGGGLMCPTRRTPQRYTVEGITSFGDGCGRKNKYGIYTTVFNYVEWMQSIMDHYS